MSEPPARDFDRDLIELALSHAWRRFEFRVSSALQILNFYLVTVAVIAGAYVGALTQGLHLVAAAIGLALSAISLAAFYGGYRQIRYAGKAVPALRELEERLAEAVGVPSFWLGAEPTRWGGRVGRSNTVAAAMFLAAVLAGLVAAAYAY